MQVVENQHHQNGFTIKKMVPVSSIAIFKYLEHKCTQLDSELSSLIDKRSLTGNTILHICSLTASASFKCNIFLIRKSSCARILLVV